LTTRHIIHGVSVTVHRYIPSERGYQTAIEVGGERWTRTVRDMGHENVDEDVAHEVRVFLIRQARASMARAKGWKVAA
jgi:hypothetical protein